jgi:hypothetical protein
LFLFANLHQPAKKKKKKALKLGCYGNFLRFVVSRAFLGTLFSSFSGAETKVGFVLAELHNGIFGLCVFIIEFLLSYVLFRLCLIPRTSAASAASCFQAPPQTLVSWQNFFKTV